MERPVLLSTPDIYIPLGGYFDPRGHIAAIDENGEDITEEVRICGCNVNPEKQGIYTVEYALARGGTEWVSYAKVIVGEEKADSLHQSLLDALEGRQKEMSGLLSHTIRKAESAALSKSDLALLAAWLENLIVYENSVYDKICALLEKNCSQK